MNTGFFVVRPVEGPFACEPAQMRLVIISNSTQPKGPGPSAGR